MHGSADFRVKALLFSFKGSFFPGIGVFLDAMAEILQL